MFWYDKSFFFFSEEKVEIRKKERWKLIQEEIEKLETRREYKKIEGRKEKKKIEEGRRKMVEVLNFTRKEINCIKRTLKSKTK